MKNSRLVGTIAAALAVVILLGLTTQPARGQAPTGNKRMQATMEKMKDALKATANTLKGEGDSEKALKHLENLQRQMLKVKPMTPFLAKELKDREEQKALTREFRRQIVGVLQQTLEIELLLLDDDTQGALEIISGELLTLRRAGHNQFQPDD